MKICFHCKNVIECDDRPHYDEICQTCGAYLRCCLNCKHFVEKFRMCRHPKGELTAYYDAKNFCTHFVFRKTKDVEKEKEDKKKWDDLFKI